MLESFFEWIEDLWIKLFGETVAFIGMGESGKTTAVRGFQALGKKEKNWKCFI